MSINDYTFTSYALPSSICLTNPLQRTVARYSTERVGWVEERNPTFSLQFSLTEPYCHIFLVFETHIDNFSSLKVLCTRPKTLNPVVSETRLLRGLFRVREFDCGAEISQNAGLFPNAASRIQ